jgi:hypothetical protein
MKQPWIHSPVFDLVWFLSPGIIPVVILLCFPSVFIGQASGISPLSWIILILFVDVSHVYSTVYRTYFKPSARQKYTSAFRLVPVIGWAVGVLLCIIQPMLFWRCLAYLAVFHFIRQQYGFLKIYSRKATAPAWVSRLHTIVIYAVTLGPILVWHFTGPKNFHWFLEGDFIYFPLPVMSTICESVFFLSVVLYVASELYLWYTQKHFNIPRSLFVLGTAASWYIGIVVYNGDLAFTMLNVLSHGIPYMALIWVSEKRESAAGTSTLLKAVFGSYGVFLFVGSLLVLGYFEEGLWDAMVWRERESIFGLFYFLQPLRNELFLAFIVPLLALPQITHYVLDGFIWKTGREKQKWLV